MLFISAALLLYSAVIVPFQICMWDYTDPCNVFPTLRFDMFVDTFFMVSPILARTCPVPGEGFPPPLSSLTAQQ